MVFRLGGKNILPSLRWVVDQFVASSGVCKNYLFPLPEEALISMMSMIAITTAKIMILKMIIKMNIILLGGHHRQ